MLAQVAEHAAARPDPRRADARHRRRRQGRGPPASIDELAAEGMAIILISSDLPEVLAMSDRVLVMREGRQMAIFDARRGRRGARHDRGDGQAGLGAADWLPPLRPERLRELSLLLVLVVAVLVFSSLIDNYLGGSFFNRVTTSVAIIAIVAAGQTIVVLTRNIDLSVGSIVGCHGVCHRRVPARPPRPDAGAGGRLRGRHRRRPRPRSTACSSPTARVPVDHRHARARWRSIRDVADRPLRRARRSPPTGCRTGCSTCPNSTLFSIGQLGHPHGGRRGRRAHRVLQLAARRPQVGPLVLRDRLEPGRRRAGRRCRCGA